MDGLSLSIPAVARRRVPPPVPTRVDRTSSTVDSTLRTTDRS